MVLNQDLYAAVSTSSLRALLVATRHRSGASRMNRPELVELMTDTLLHEEVDQLERAARCKIENIVNLGTFLPKVHRRLRDQFGQVVDPYLSSVPRLAHAQLGRHWLEQRGSAESVQEPTIDWPQPVVQDVKDECARNFINYTNIAVAATCSVCARRCFSQDLLFTNKHTSYRTIPTSALDLTVLTVTDPHLLNRPGDHFKYTDAALDGLALDKSGILSREDGTHLNICDDCYRALSADPPILPALALANGNVRGRLPPHLQDCTWLEERLCAVHMATAYVVRLYDCTSPSAPEARSRVMKGHTCAFPLNTVSTAQALPWSLDEANPLVACVVIGPRQPRLDDLRNVFNVRRRVVRDLFLFLRENFKGYPQFQLNQAAMASLPEDGVPETILNRVIYQPHDDVRSLLAQETAGLDVHPIFAQDTGSTDTLDGTTFLEHHGLLDVDGTNVSSSSRTASALANATGSGRPDLVIRRGAEIVQDYNNPAYFPGLFPCLFPWGTGGFEDHRITRLSFDKQSQHLLDLADPSFRRHWSFIFIVANIKQRRAIHWGSRLVCNAKDFPAFSKTLARLTPQAVKCIADRVEKGGRMDDLSVEERPIFALLNKCDVVSAHVPGSRAVMIRTRSDIRAYIGRFGIFQLFLTLNPSATHSPVFHVFFGDDSVRLDLRRPVLPSSKERAERVANDPVAASDFFHFHTAAVFQYLLGWDIRAKKATERGGIFGRMAAFVQVKEHTMRGHLHCHCLIWLEGGLNPSELRSKLGTDEEFRDRYFHFFDDIITHDASSLPQDSDLCELAARNLRQERPAHPDDPDYRRAVCEDHHVLAKEVQHHRHTQTCFKNGRLGCRFLFPHDIVPSSFYDADTKSISLRVLDEYVNWHNKLLLFLCRHNQDVKSVQSGKSCAATACYVTAYATKSDETPLSQAALIAAVYERMAAQSISTDDARAVLVRCVMHLGRQRQLHAQQAATYVRELGDVLKSHDTVPMLSYHMINTVQQLFGPCSVTSAQPSSTHTADTAPTCNTITTDASLPSGTDAMDATQPSSPDGTGANEDMDQEPETLLAEDELSFRTMSLNNRGLANQIDDYMLRAETLSSLSFYDFVAFVELWNKPKKTPNKNHHFLPPSHPNAATHVHRYTGQERGIPRPICARFPRSDGSPTHGDAYCCAMMAHFIPFSAKHPLKTRDVSWTHAFRVAKFSASARRTMANWAALSECEDSRDAEQLLRRRQEADKALRAERDRVSDVEPPPGTALMTDVDMESLLSTQNYVCMEAARFSERLDKNGWFDVTDGTCLSPPTYSTPIQCTPRDRQTWTREQATIEAEARAALATPSAATGVLAEQIMFERATAASASTTITGASFPPIPAPSTQYHVWNDRPPHLLLDALVQEQRLSPSQALAFNIVGRRFFESLYGQSPPPLRLLMHGEAGTGKTVVVRLLRKLMDTYGRGNEIMFVAPTGKAAAAIGGVTQHAAFGLEVRRRGLTAEELEAAPAAAPSRRQRYLQETFSNVNWIFFDEVSMTSSEVICDIDQALRIGTQRELPFGGINVLFAGDFCQLPPVGASPLYAPASSANAPSNTRTKTGLGRLAWLHIDEVVEFTHQQRMQDPLMAAALSRLRLRRCTVADVELFNANVLPATGAAATLLGRHDVIVLASTNDAVRQLNHQKAAIEAASDRQRLAISHASDSSSTAISPELRASLLSYNGRSTVKVLMGRLPLFAGMPVVYRGPNLSVALGITNGSFGKVVAWKLQLDSFGLSTPVMAIVQFQPDAKWALSGLPPGSVPIYPTTSSFNFQPGSTSTVIHTIKRTQLPLQPGFAMTVHSAQGITSSGGVVVDLCKGGFHTYVAASRATRRQDIFLVREVSLTQLNEPPLPPSLVDELERFRRLAEATHARHGHSDWRLSSTSAPLRSRPSLNSPAPKRART